MKTIRMMTAVAAVAAVVGGAIAAGSLSSLKARLLLALLLRGGAQRSDVARTFAEYA